MAGLPFAPKADDVLWDPREKKTIEIMNLIYKKMIKMLIKTREDWT